MLSKQIGSLHQADHSLFMAEKSPLKSIWGFRLKKGQVRRIGQNIITPSEYESVGTPKSFYFILGNCKLSSMNGLNYHDVNWSV
ncbi:hypothetical protein FKM82_024549 [Ascaphus truei]